jgi:hypothetical protein
MEGAESGHGADEDEIERLAQLGLTYEKEDAR